MRNLLLIPLALAATGCFSAYDVRTPACEPDAGIPFFVKRPLYVHTTTYQVSWLHAELRIKRGEGDKAETKSLGRDFEADKMGELQRLQTRIALEDTNAAAVAPVVAALNRGDAIDIPLVNRASAYVTDARHAAELEKLRSSVADPSTGEEKKEEARRQVLSMVGETAAAIQQGIEAQFLAIEALSERPIDVFRRKPVVVGNGVAQSSVVDYSRPYYYNVRAPMFSKIDTQVELNSDLLLTKAQSNVDTTTVAESIEKLVPLKEIITGALQGTTGAGAAALRVEPPAKVTVTLEITEQVRNVEYTARSECPIDPPTLLPFGNSGQFIVKPVATASTDAKASTASKDAKTNVISITGEVTVPKAETK